MVGANLTDFNHRSRPIKNNVRDIVCCTPGSVQLGLIVFSIRDSIDSVKIWLIPPLIEILSTRKYQVQYACKEIRNSSEVLRQFELTLTGNRNSSCWYKFVSYLGRTRGGGGGENL